jgi:Icc-related predicted phosphoesterase
MLRIAVFGDIHDHQERLGITLDLLGRRIRDQADSGRFDLALLAGDVGLDPPWFSPARETQRAAHDESMRRTVGGVAEVLRCPVLFVPGNHDLRDPVEEIAGVNIDGRVHRVRGLRVAGFGGAGPTPYGFPYEWTEREAALSLEAMFGGEPNSPDIFLSHTPPVKTTLDRTARGAHVGSPAVRDWLRRVRPRLFVCGHIHEARGVERVEGVPCLNAGALGEPHGEAIVWIVQWESGSPIRVESLRPGPEGEPEVRVW